MMRERFGDPVNRDLRLRVDGVAHPFNRNNWRVGMATMELASLAIIAASANVGNWKSAAVYTGLNLVLKAGLVAATRR